VGISGEKKPGELAPCGFPPMRNALQGMETDPGKRVPGAGVFGKKKARGACSLRFSGNALQGMDANPGNKFPGFY
jgi:hypothetical protein